MPNKQFWNWQKTSKICKGCDDASKHCITDCMKCEIIWEAALKSVEPANSGEAPTDNSASLLYLEPQPPDGGK